MANKLSFHKQFKSFKKTEFDGVDMPGGRFVSMFYQVDKNGQICDCTRIGNSLDRLRGVPENSINPFDVIKEELFNGE